MIVFMNLFSLLRTRRHFFVKFIDKKVCRFLKWTNVNTYNKSIWELGKVSGKTINKKHKVFATRGWKRGRQW